VLGGGSEPRFLVHLAGEEASEGELISGGRSMKRKRPTESQIVFALQQAEGGAPMGTCLTRDR